MCKVHSQSKTKQKFKMTALTEEKIQVGAAVAAADVDTSFKSVR